MITECREKISAVKEKIGNGWEKYGALTTRVAVWCSFSLVLLGIILTGVRLINGIKAAESQERSCYVLPDHVTYIPVENQIFYGEFAAISPGLKHVDIWLPEDTQCTEGYFSYELQDREGKVLYSASNLDIGPSLNELGNRVQIDVSELNLLHGETYGLQLKIDTGEPLTVATDGSSLVLEQFYLMSYGWLIVGITIIAGAAAAGCMAIAIKTGMSNRLFVGLALGAGIFFALIMPPANRDDEYRHFIRAYDLSRPDIQGNYVLTDGTERGNVFRGEDGKAAILVVPEEINKLRTLELGEEQNTISYYGEINLSLSLDKLLSILKLPESEDTARVSETATLHRSAGDYWPQVLFLWLGRLLGLRSTYQYYFARFGQVFFCTLLAYIALRLVPEYRPAIWAVYFIPEAMLLRSSCNPDGLMMGEIILFIAYILHLRLRDKEFLSPKRLIFIFLLLFCIYRMKSPYAILCLASLFLLKKDNFKVLQRLKVWNYRRIIGLAIFLILGASIAVIFATGQMRTFFLHATGGYLSTDHVEYIFDNPGTVFFLFLLKGWDLFKECLTAFRGSFYLSYLGVAAIALLFCKRRLGYLNKLYCVLVLGGMLLLIVLAGYSLTPANYGIIWGITFRYILPVLPLACLVPALGNEKTEQVVCRMYPILLIGILGANAMILVSQFLVLEQPFG